MTEDTVGARAAAVMCCNGFWEEVPAFAPVRMRKTKQCVLKHVGNNL